MTALTADRNTQMKDPSVVSFKVAASTKIYAGSIVVANASGYAVPGATAATLTYLGRAEETVDNTSGSNGDLSVRVRRGQAFKWGNSGADAITQAEIGKTCYIVDDQTLAKTSNTGARSAAGVVLGLDADGVWIL